MVKSFQTSEHLAEKIPLSIMIFTAMPGVSLRKLVPGRFRFEA